MFDILIIGSGPAGMTAAIYGKRSGLDVAIFEKGAPGGAMINTNKIENYPGVLSCDGATLAMNMYEQMSNLGVTYFSLEVEKIEKENDIFKVYANNEVYLSKTVIIATGTKNKKLSVKNEDKFSGRGISWCAICDGNFYKNKRVAVVGGGNSALEEGLYLSTLASKVYVIHRRDSFKADDIIVKKLKEKENVEFILDTTVNEFSGDKRLEKILIYNVKEKTEKWLDIDGVFEYIGQEADYKFFKDLDICNEKGYIIVDFNFETKIKGLFAAGDIVNKEIRQIATAVNDGAIAALNASRYCK